MPGLGRQSAGSEASAWSRTVMWSAAVLDPALPLRSSPAKASPPAISGRSRNASNGWWPKDYLLTELTHRSGVAMASGAARPFYVPEHG